MFRLVIARDEILTIIRYGRSWNFTCGTVCCAPTSHSQTNNLSAQRSRPFGSEDWVIKTAKQLGLESTTNPRGRPERFRKDPFCRSRSHPRRNSGPLPTKTTRSIQSCIDNIHPPYLSSIPMCSSKSADEGIADTQFAVQFNGLPSKLAGMSKPKYRKIVGAISTMRPLVLCPRSTPWPYMMANPWGL